MPFLNFLLVLFLSRELC